MLLFRDSGRAGELGETTVLPRSELISVSLPCSRLDFADRSIFEFRN